jgi:hypothetical protein
MALSKYFAKRQHGELSCFAAGSKAAAAKEVLPTSVFGSRGLSKYFLRIREMRTLTDPLEHTDPGKIREPGCLL